MKYLTEKEMQLSENDIIKFKENNILATYYPISKASKKLNMSLQKTQRLFKLGTFPNSIKLGQNYYISKKDVISFSNLLEKKRNFLYHKRYK
ncbi:hypothetical protein ACT7CX_12765 [Bacillus cereus]